MVASSGKMGNAAAYRVDAVAVPDQADIVAGLAPRYEEPALPRPSKRVAPLSQKAVDALYLCLVAFTALLVATLVGMSVLQITRETSLVLALSLSFELFTVGMGALSMSVLAWRIWMAVLYRPFPPADDDMLPHVTVVIPAYNEGAQILPTVRSVMASAYPPGKMTVICVDDGSTDDTYQWMRRAWREFPRRLRLVRQPSNLGKRRALQAGFCHAEGSVYVTIDSDSEIAPETLRHLVSPFVASPKVGAVAGNVRVLNRREGAIPQMLEVAFTTAFDFVRAGQSVYGGVFCTPGALSAYRASVIQEHMDAWINQTFMGVRANIGEDRALTNLVLRNGYRVAYQRDAVVLTKVPTTLRGLRLMLLRWARSNVRESLVMAGFMLRHFRAGDKGAGWIRLFGSLQIVRLSVGEMLKVGLLAQLVMDPVTSLRALLYGCVFASLLPALVYHVRYRSWLGWRWALPYSFFWLVCLSWISAWGLVSASRSRWLTRTPQTRAQSGGAR